MNIKRNLLAFSALLISFVSTLVALISVRVGLDLSDEGFYLSSIKQPSINNPQFSFFGKVYNYVFLFGNRELLTLRTFVIVSVIFQAFIVTFLILNHKLTQKRLTFIERMTILLTLTSSAIQIFIFNGQWLASPSYNTLTFQGLLMCWTGYLIGKKNVNNKMHLGISLLIMSIGTSLTLLGKVTSGLLLLLTINLLELSTVISNFEKLKKIILGLFAYNLMSLTIFFKFAGGIFETLSNFAHAYFLDRKLGGNHNLMFMALKFLRPNQYFEFFLCFLIVLSYLVVKKRLRFNENFMINSGLISLTLFLSIGLLEFCYDLKLLTATSLLTFAKILVVFLICILSTLLFNKKKVFVLSPFNDLRIVSLALISPVISAFGSNNDFIVMFRSNIFFFFLFVILMLTLFNIQIESLLKVNLSITIVVCLTILIAVLNPYRQSPNTGNFVESKEIVGLEKVWISPTTHKFLLGINAFLVENRNLRAYYLDLTGKSPGVAFVFGLEPLGDYWLFGGYKGSEDYARTRLESEKCIFSKDLVILLQDKGTRALSKNLLGEFGLVLSETYVSRNRYKVITLNHTESYKIVLYSSAANFEKCSS